jgi:hypothetical protein
MRRPASPQVLELRAQLDSFDQRMDEELQQVEGGGAGSGRGSGSGRAGGLSQSELVSMTIPNMKTWLTSHGFDQEAWALSTRKPAAKKGDWVALVTEKAGAL